MSAAPSKNSPEQQAGCMFLDTMRLVFVREVFLRSAVLTFCPGSAWFLPGPIQESDASPILAIKSGARSFLWVCNEKIAPAFLTSAQLWNNDPGARPLPF